MANPQKMSGGQDGPALSGPAMVHLEFIDEGAIAVITLDDPKRGNAMSPAMGDAFAAVVKRLNEHDALGAVIVRGAGKNFSIGGSRDMLTHLADPSLSDEARRTFMLGFYDRWLSLLDIPVPVIAAIEGDCVGVAPIFACASDICVADETATFHITFAGLGLFPGMAMSYLVPRIVGAQQAAVLMVAGAPFSGREAATCGFVARSVSKGAVHEEALKLARQIAGNVTETVRALTQTLRIKRSELQPVLESDAVRQARSYVSDAYRQRIAKYLPNWYDTKEESA
jgi:enoyl-CoA hydratase/carnithine racemase